MNYNIKITDGEVKVKQGPDLIGRATLRIVDAFPAEAEAPLYTSFYALPEPADGCRLTADGERWRSNYRCYNAAIALNDRAGREVARLARGDYPDVYLLRA